MCGCALYGARCVLSAMEMKFWLPQVEAALA